MRCDRCGKEITGHFFELEGYLWEEHAQSDLEMILCDACYNGENNYKQEIPKPHFISDIIPMAGKMGVEFALVLSMVTYKFLGL